MAALKKNRSKEKAGPSELGMTPFVGARAMREWWAAQSGVMDKKGQKRQSGDWRSRGDFRALLFC
jgi:hypothetical protein